MRMRQSETFSVITDEITQDLTTVNDALMQSSKKKPRNDQDQPRWRSPKGYTGKGKNNKGKGKGSGGTWQWQQQPRATTWQSPTFPPQPPMMTVPSPSLPITTGPNWTHPQTATWNTQHQAQTPQSCATTTPTKGKAGKEGKGHKGKGKGKNQH